MDPNHVDLAGKIVAWQDFVHGRAQPYDDNGHGTNVAGVAAGRGAGDADYTGVAPAATIAAAKVLDRQGSGTTSNIMAGVQWCIDNRASYNIRVLDLSLGSTGSSDGTDPLSQMVNAAVDAGRVAAVAAGNEGPAVYTVGSPAAEARAVTVGAMGDVGEKGFFLAYFSSRGPTGG